jgi:hypothetical protein
LYLCGGWGFQTSSPAIVTLIASSRYAIPIDATFNCILFDVPTPTLRFVIEGGLLYDDWRGRANA